MHSEIPINKDEFIKNKSFEIAWAAFRCANFIKQPALKAELENMAVDIIVHTESDHLEQLEQLIRLAEVVGEISKTNAFVLFRELDNLKEAVRQRNSAIRQEKENSSAIEKIFTKPPKGLFSENPDSSASLREVSRRETTVHPSADGSPQGVFKKVKELGKTTTKELSSFFPGISERTVRFYLQGLCEQGLVSRVGTTGPGSYYVAK